MSVIQFFLMEILQPDRMATPQLCHHSNLEKENEKPLADSTIPIAKSHTQSVTKTSFVSAVHAVHISRQKR